MLTVSFLLFQLVLMSALIWENLKQESLLTFNFNYEVKHVLIILTKLLYIQPENWFYYRFNHKAII
jgi:hypothetical protein